MNVDAGKLLAALERSRHECSSHDQVAEEDDRKSTTELTVRVVTRDEPLEQGAADPNEETLRMRAVPQP